MSCFSAGHLAYYLGLMVFVFFACSDGDYFFVPQKEDPNIDMRLAYGDFVPDGNNAKDDSVSDGYIADNEDDNLLY